MLALVVPLLAACQFVIGLDGYTKGDASVPDGEVPKDGGGVDVNELPDVFTKPADWAKWRMPNPTFTPAGSGDAGTDARYNQATVVSLGQFSFDGGSYTLYTDRYQGEDAGTGLLWIFEPSPSNVVDDFAAATKYCADRSGRLPTRIELLTLVDFTKTTGTRTMNGVPPDAIGANRYWTASLVRPYSAEAGIQYWAVSFDGTTNTMVTVASKLDRVVCVRAQ